MNRFGKLFTSAAVMGAREAVNPPVFFLLEA